MIEYITRIKCDKCKKTTDFVYRFHISYITADKDCELKDCLKTKEQEYCKECFNKILKTLHIEKEQNNGTDRT